MESPGADGSSAATHSPTPRPTTSCTWSRNAACSPSSTYAGSEAALEALKERAMQRATDTGRPPAARFMTADAQTMRETLTWLHTEHGGFEPYMLGHGLSDGELALLRMSLVEPALVEPST